MPVEDDDSLGELLDYDVIAVVGCSSNPRKDAHRVPRYLLERGYEIVPVNPTADEIFGRRTYDTLAEVDEEVELVNVFRPSEEVSGIADEAIDREDVLAIWTQLGIRDPEAARRAEEAGLTVVQDRCMKAEHWRLMG